MGKVRAFLVASFVVLTVALVVLLRTTHQEGGTEITTRIPRTAWHSTWLKLHPPRRTQHDAELLRRRMLMSIEELDAAALAPHAPQLLASLGHRDRQVRQQALRLLGKLEPQVIEDRSAALSALLASTADEVRLYVLETLVKLGRAPTIAANGALIFDGLSAASPEVRRASIAALALLEPEDLAQYSEAAAEVLLRQRNTTLVQAAATSWEPQLRSDACTARAGPSACSNVLEALRGVAAGGP